MKFIFCAAALLHPISEDNPQIKYKAAIIIEDENKTVSFSMPLDIDEKLSKPYEPFFTRVLNMEKMIELRDGLTKLINSSIMEN